MSDNSNVTGMGDNMHPVDVLNKIPMADVVEIAVVFKTKAGNITAYWSTQSNEALCFKATCLAKWAENNIT